MKIFVSHSMKDNKLISDLVSELEPHGLKLLIAEHVVALDMTITEKIESMIHESELAMILLTGNGANSDFVKQEIGFISALKKKFLIIVEKGFESKVQGFIYGYDFISFDPADTSSVIRKIKKTLQIKPAVKKQSVAKNENEDMAYAIGVGLFTVMIVSIFALYILDKSKKETNEQPRKIMKLS